MKNMPSSTIEPTMENDQDHRSQVTSKCKRQPRRVSTRQRSAKERQDTSKFKKYRKRNQKKKLFSNKIIHIKEKKVQISKIKKTPKIAYQHQKQIKEDKKSKTTSTDLKPTEEQRRQHELESTLTFSLSTEDHHYEAKPTHKNDTTTNSNSISAIFSDDDSTSTTQIFTVNKSKHSHVSKNTDCTKTKNKMNEDVNNTNDETNTKSDTLQSIYSATTGTTTMFSSFDFINVKSEQNDLDIEDEVEESKKSNFIWCSFISGTIGFILLFAAYYFGSNILKEKCIQHIEIYMNQNPLQEYYFNYRVSNHESIEKSFNRFEVFNKKSTDPKCRWISQFQRKIAFEKKFDEKHREKIDEFFLKYAQQMTIQYLTQSNANQDNVRRLTGVFPKIQHIHKTEIKYPPLAKYFQQKKAKLKQNNKIIPSQITLAGSSNDEFKIAIDGTYEIDSWDTTTNTLTYRKSNASGRTGMGFKYDNESQTWKIRSFNFKNYTYVEFKNSKNVLNPGQLDTKDVVYGDEQEKETQIPDLKITRHL